MDAKDMLGIIAALVSVLATGLFGYWQFLNQRRSIINLQHRQAQHRKLLMKK
jgi:hypothetical protein